MPTADELTTQQKAQWNAAALSWERQGDWFDRNTGNLADWLCDAAGLQPGHTALVSPPRPPPGACVRADA